MAYHGGSSEKRRFGRYYTPSKLAHILANWAIRNPGTTVLDPCFGGCEFLYKAAEILRKYEEVTPGRFLFGVDIDSEAREYLEPLYKQGAQESHFYTSDFFDVSPDDFHYSKFDAILTNPPYVRHHLIPKDKREKAANVVSDLGFDISGKASYWAYFLAYGSHFLSKRGRLAMVLPGTSLHANYSVKLLKQLLRQMKSVTLVLIKQRLFKDTSEESVLFLAEGHGKPNADFRVLTVSSLEDLNQALVNTSLTGQTEVKRYFEGKILAALLPRKTLKLYQRLQKKSSKFGDLAKIRIGVVTGANKFFTMSIKQRESLGIPEHFFTPIVSKSNWLKCLQFTSRDLFSRDDEDRTELLTIHDRQNLPAPLLHYIQEGVRTEISSRYHCRSREIWYQLKNIYKPQAFLTYMSHILPRLVINDSMATCTNTIHRVKFQGDLTRREQEAIALSMLTSFSQLSFEIVGRSYGGGVLKLEPNEASSVSILIPTDKLMNSIFQEIDLLMRSGEYWKAIKLVDDLILRNSFNLSPNQIRILRRGWLQLTRRRVQYNPPLLTQLLA